MTEVRPVAGRRGIRQFVDYAYALNARDPHWIPELRLSARERLTAAKNPFFEHAEIQLFLAYDGDDLVGPDAAPSDQGARDLADISPPLFRVLLGPTRMRRVNTSAIPSPAT